MPKLVCVPCQRQYKVVKNGNYVIGMFSILPQPYQPYRIQNGDRWECPHCGHQIIAGFAVVSVAEHFEDKFQELLEKALAIEDTIYCYER